MVGDVKDHVAEVNPGDPLYRDLQLRGYNRRFVGTPDSVFVVATRVQVVKAVDAVVASGTKLAVRSGGHCTEGFVDDPAVHLPLRVDHGRLRRGGEMNARSPRDTAVAERDSVALFSVGNFWDNPGEDEKHLTWNRTLYREVFAATGGVPVPNADGNPHHVLSVDSG